MDTTDIILLLILAFIMGLIIGKKCLSNSLKEGLINLDDSRKVELTKCCKDCYFKPEFLRTECEENKKKAFEELNKQFQEAYTQEQYYKLLNDLNILKNIPNYKNYLEYNKNRDEKIETNEKMTNELMQQIIKDDRDEVKGYDLKNYAPY
jgi:hypothetical protein